MSVSAETIPEKALIDIPKGLRKPLLDTFNVIVKNFQQGKWEPAELNGGKFCEIVYTILRGHVDGKFPSGPKKPRNMVDACRKLEQADKERFLRSVRIQIPRMLIALYEVRNNRGVGHTGGDVDPNHMDALVVLSVSKWIMAECVRIFHDLPTDLATSIVDSLVERTIPIVWKVFGKHRVLDPRLSYKDRVLILLYESTSPVSESDLVEWIEHSNSAVFRRDILVRAHKAKLIEYDRESRMVQISPLGTRYVEDNLTLGL